MRTQVNALSLVLLCAVMGSIPAVADQAAKPPTLKELEADMANKIASKSPGDLAKFMAAMEFQRLKAVRAYKDQKGAVTDARRMTIELRKELDECKAR